MCKNVRRKAIKSQITWVTPDYFIDCDFNPDLFSDILKYYDVNWIVLLPYKNARYSESDFDRIKKLEGIRVEIMYWSSRARSPKMLLFYEKVYKRIKSLNSDLIYFNYIPTSPYVLPLYWRLKKSKTIVTAHDGNVKSSFKMEWISKFVFKLAFSAVKYVNMFSHTEEALFKSNFPKAKTFVIPLTLKDFGNSTLKKRKDNIVFFFFGTINSNKNLELLIDAASNLYEKGVRGFKVSISGSCSNWEIYKSRIRYENLFECNIRFFKNSEIPDLFAANHYMVFPYKEMSQSGALKVAFNYNVPVLVSDLKGFTDEVKDGINGFVFKSCDVQDLEQLMTERIENHSTDYKMLQERVSNYNKLYYSNEAIKKKYLDMFDEVLFANSAKEG